MVTEVKQTKQEVFMENIRVLRQAVPELQGVMITGIDGLPIAYDFPETESARIAAMAATAYGIGTRISESTQLGQFHEMVVRGDKGYLVIYKSGENGVLAVQAPNLANIGLIHLETRSVVQEIANSL